jgi:DnaA family protein
MLQLGIFFDSTRHGRSGMRQLTLAISSPPEPSLDNFVPGRNAELLARLQELRSGRLGESVVYLWGSPGCGRTHLLRACAGPNVATADDVERLDEAGAAALFSRINEAREGGSAILAAGDAPPAQLPLREDLRTRLAWGLVYQVQPLTDEDRALYLVSQAERRGMHLPDDVVRYILARARRDAASLAAILELLDRTSLERQRPLTVPLVREALKTPAE